MPESFCLGLLLLLLFHHVSGRGKSTEKFAPRFGELWESGSYMAGACH